MSRTAFTFVIYFILGTASLFGQEKEIKVDWEKEKIAPGLVWKFAHPGSLFGDPQHISMLEINPKKRKLTLIYNPEENEPTSLQANRAGAIAAVNAGFFDVKNGGSVTYIKVDGVILDEDTVGKWPSNKNLNGALLISNAGNMTVEYQKANNLYDEDSYQEDVLVTGPVLIDDGTAQALNNSDFVQKRHPRTCACIGKKRIMLITIDGRSEQAAGMSLPELKEFLVSLGCKEAINLDGGGSTTMWIKDETPNGVVNMPSDNKKFDHEGERKVANIIAIF